MQASVVKHRAWLIGGALLAASLALYAAGGGSRQPAVARVLISLVTLPRQCAIGLCASARKRQAK